MISIDQFAAKLKKAGPANGKGERKACCPAHDDRNPSLSFWIDDEGTLAVNCWSGCTQEQILSAMGLTWRDLKAESVEGGGGVARLFESVPVSEIVKPGYSQGWDTAKPVGSVKPEPKKAKPKQKYGCTVAQYLEKTGMPEVDVVGLVDGKRWIKDVGEVPAVGIPYYDEAEQEIYKKWRVAVSGRDKYRYESGTSPKLYGLNQLDDARGMGKIVFVEGESDAQTLWLKYIPTVGVPGCSTVNKTIEERHLVDIQKIYAVEEDDEAGRKFVLAIADRVKELGLSTPVFRVVLKVDVDGTETHFKDTNEMYQDDPALFAGRFERCCLTSRSIRPADPVTGVRRVSEVKYKYIGDIMRQDYPPIRWVVGGVLPEGLAMLYSAPKVGKSFLALQVAAAVAHGSALWNHTAWKPEAGEIAIIDLEQVEGAQMQGRFKHHGMTEDDYGAILIDDFPALDQGGEEELEILLNENPGLRLVIVDVWANVKPTAKGTSNAYDFEYKIAKRLRTLFLRRQCCCLVIHHDRKSEGGGITDKASGSKALPAACNVVMWLQRSTGEANGTLTVTGRDVADVSLQCKFEERSWTVFPETETVEAQW